MKVLFVSSGNSVNGIGIIVKNQGESLIKKGIDITFYTITGKGITGYIRNIPRLAGQIRKDQYDIIHAHYSLSAFVATMSTRKPVIVSLMGSDTQVTGLMRSFIRILSKYFWAATIVKTNRMKTMLRLENSAVIPNGVDLDQFVHVTQTEAQLKVGFNPGNKHIVFFSNPERREKNFTLASEAVNLLNYPRKVEFHVVYNVDFSMVRYYLYAADVLLLTSYYEGSPNIIKEALACNLPIVATNVGDIRENIEAVSGCFITDFDPKDVAVKLKCALDFDHKTTGRKVIEERFDSQMIAVKLSYVYNEVLSARKTVI